MIDKDKVIQVVELSKNAQGNIDWKQVVEKLNLEFGMHKSKAYYRSLYRRSIGDKTYYPKLSNKLHTDDNRTIEIPPQPSQKRISVETGANGTQKSEMLVDIVQHPLKTPQDVLNLHGYDLGEWELVNHKLKLWNTYSKQDGTTELYSSAITVKPLKEGVNSEFITQMYEELADKYINNQIKPEVSFEKKDDGHLLEIGLYDVHLGKFAWSEETRNDFDLKIAVKLYKDVFLELIEKTKPYNIDKALIVFGNDYFHYDNMEEKTTGGTKQDTDTRLAKMYNTGADLMLWTIEQLKLIAPTIDFLYIPSNHDYTLSYFLAHLIKTMYEDDFRITYLECSPISRKYYHYNNVLLGFTHGDKETKKNITTLMQFEEAGKWAKTYVHEWHVGHLHSESSENHNGLVIKRFPSITATDLWHYQKGWVGAIRKGVAYLWHPSGSKVILESLVTHHLEEQD